MRANRVTAILTAAALLAGCATAEEYRDICRAEHSESASIEDCATRRADNANTTAVVVTIVGAVLVGALAAAAAGAGSSKNNPDYGCFPLGCPPQTRR